MRPIAPAALTDLSGSTIALVNAASPGSPPATGFTYDPSGNTTVSGSANSWPFEYRGMEHEITDPANLYFLPSSNVYNPRMQAALSQVGPQGLSGPGGGPAGNAEMPPSGTSGGLTWQSYQNDLSQSEQVGASTFVVGSFITLGEAPIAASLAAIAYTVDFLVNFFEDIFGGSSSPPIPRQLMHARHPLYGVILGILEGLIANESSPMFEVYAALGAGPSNIPPLRRVGYSEPGVVTVQFWGYNYCGPGNNGGPTIPGTTDDCCKQHDQCYANHGLSWLDAILHLGGLGAGSAQAQCDRGLCNCVGRLTSPPSSPYDYRMRNGIGNTFCY